MKRIFAFLLCGLLLCSLLACGKTDDDGSSLNGDEDQEIVTTSAGDTFTFEPLDSESVQITSYRGNYVAHEVVVPDTIGSSKVVAIGKNAFYQNIFITGITLPATVTTIDDYAFAGCTSLKAITLPDNLEVIGKGAFYGCTGLKSLTMGSKVETIDDNAFYKCTGMETINLSEGLNAIGEAAFFHCDSLTEVVVPEGTVKIGKMAFYNCRSLATLTLPASIEEIGEYALRQAPDTDETNEDGEDTFVPLQVITVEGSYAAEYVSQNVPAYEPKETTSPETDAESEVIPPESESETAE